ncbi:MAG: hypothetical protein M1833_003009 [Piccolia ochrophora]|nr:MAG: hypothetical protein M1833_003009 [Piccolia ochrophora]
MALSKRATLQMLYSSEMRTLVDQCDQRYPTHQTIYNAIDKGQAIGEGKLAEQPFLFKDTSYYVWESQGQPHATAYLDVPVLRDEYGFLLPFVFEATWIRPSVEVALTKWCSGSPVQASFEYFVQRLRGSADFMPNVVMRLHRAGPGGRESVLPFYRLTFDDAGTARVVKEGRTPYYRKTNQHYVLFPPDASTSRRGNVGVDFVTMGGAPIGPDVRIFVLVSTS